MDNHVLGDPSSGAAGQAESHPRAGPPKPLSGHLGVWWNSRIRGGCHPVIASATPAEPVIGKRKRGFLPFFVRQRRLTYWRDRPPCLSMGELSC
ncbi:MAG TPA: hypothetical protein PLZ55_09775, partial [bacterium]|nr:hypothetical protein [bacterium]